MKCRLCDKDIENYNPDFNHLTINEELSADICGECTDKFMKWQGQKLAKLFPTKTMKKRFGGKSA
jgi:hypothetical protein